VRSGSHLPDLIATLYAARSDCIERNGEPSSPPEALNQSVEGGLVFASGRGGIGAYGAGRFYPALATAPPPMLA
jgi:hypothetical protein